MKKIVIDGPDQILYQWDKGQRLLLHGAESGTRVDFARCNDNKAVSQYAYSEDEAVFCDIPDALLMEPNHLHGYVYEIDGDRGETVREFMLPVIRRPKPEDYVEPEEIPIWHDLQQQIDELKENGVGNSTLVQSVNGIAPDENGNVEIDFDDPVETDPTVFDWAKRELFNKADLPTSIQSFVTVDGIEYYRYHAGATYGFTWYNPSPLPGAVTITARGVAQYGGTNGTRLKTIYSDGTYGPDLYIVASGESRTVTVTTDTSKTLAKITGSYDMENWVLLDMSVMSVQANYNRGLPVADANATGGVLADPATDADTIPARIKDGRLFVAGATDEQIAQAVSDYMADHPIEVPDSSQNVDLTGYAKEQWVQEGFQPKGDYLTAVPAGYATEEFVKNKIAEAELGGEEVDLSGYAQKSELPTKVSELENDAGYLTEHQDLSDYAKKTELPVVPVQSINGKTGTVKLSASDVGARPNTWMPTAQDVGALPSTYTPPNQTAEQVGADPKGTAANAVSQHNTSDDAHNDIRLELKAISDRLTAFFDSDNPTLDELSEIVAYITSNKALIDSVSNSLANYQPKGDYALRSEIPTVPTKVSAFTNDVGYLTEHQDISGKLDAAKLPEAINTALAQAKESGEYDGKAGYTPIRGTDYWTDSDKAEIQTYVENAILGGAW